MPVWGTWINVRRFCFPGAKWCSKEEAVSAFCLALRCRQQGDAGSEGTRQGENCIEAGRACRADELDFYFAYLFMMPGSGDFAMIQHQEQGAARAWLKTPGGALKAGFKQDGQAIFYPGLVEKIAHCRGVDG